MRGATRHAWLLDRAGDAVELVRNGDVADTYLGAHWQPYPFPFPFPQTGTNSHRYESVRTQNESGRDGKGKSGRDGERESGQDSERESGRDGKRVGERESRRDDERAARRRARGTTRGRQEGEREGRQGRVTSQDEGTMMMTRPRMRHEECVKGENGMVSRNSE